MGAGFTKESAEEVKTNRVLGCEDRTKRNYLKGEGCKRKKRDGNREGKEEERRVRAAGMIEDPAMGTRRGKG